jgi:hypothetical protein
VGAVLTTALLACVAFAAGVTGAWSPCGFSMVETLAGAAGRSGAAGRRLVRASCATFAVGAVAGGALTFTALGAFGALLGAGGTDTLIAAVVIAATAALFDARGKPVAPQIRRQVPEPWRRTLPLPAAAALYGVLLGLGFTTFVLAFAVWALAGIAVAVGAPATGLAIGVAFGLGRALPVVAMAPRHDTLGTRLATRMAEEPALLRRLRLADALLLAAAAVALALGPAAASADAAAGDSASSAGTARVAVPPPATGTAQLRRVAAPGAYPSAADGALAWSAGGERALLLDADGARTTLVARRAAIGGPWLALLTGGTIQVMRRTGGTPLATIPAPGADELAVSEGWVAWRERSRDGRHERLLAAALPGAAAASEAHAAPAAGGLEPAPARLAGSPAPPGEAFQIARQPTGALGRPALDGDRLVYAVTTRRGSRIVVHDVRAVTDRVVRRSSRTQLSQPTLLGDRLLYVDVRVCDQRLQLATLGRGRAVRPDRTLARLGGLGQRDAGHEHHHTSQGSEPTGCPPGTPPPAKRILWATALTADTAYVTLLRPRAGDAARATLARVAL